MKIAVVQGTRPEIIKNYSVVKALGTSGVAFEVLHTNQHHEPAMCSDVYRDMGYEPTRTMSGEYRLGTAIDWLQDRFRKDGITQVIVNGDTAASLAGALAAMYLDIPVSHIEAGLRSHDAHMLEERNRIIVDSIAQNLFAYTEVELESLRNTDGIRGDVHLVGNTTVDLLHDFRIAFTAPVRAGRYAYVTMHRKEFTDSPERMATVFKALAQLAATECAVVFPMHPRTRDVIRRHGLSMALLGDVEVIDAVGIFESLALQRHAAAVITDSGCVQEEAYLLGVPCVTVRENTERQLTVRHRANVVTGFAPEKIHSGVLWALGLSHRVWPNIYGMPGVGKRIVECMTGVALVAPRPVELAYG